jgi:hypothetical protein
VEKDFLEGEIIPAGIQDKESFFLSGKFAPVEVSGPIAEDDGIEFQALCLKEGVREIGGPAREASLRKIYLPTLKCGVHEREEVEVPYTVRERDLPGLEGRMGEKCFLSFQTAPFEGNLVGFKIAIGKIQLLSREGCLLENEFPPFETGPRK